MMDLGKVQAKLINVLLALAPPIGPPLYYKLKSANNL